MNSLPKPWILAAFVVLALLSPPAMGAEIQVTKAWSRATVGSGGNGVVYLTIENTGTSAERIVSLSSPVAQVAAVHQTVRKDGMMQMLPAPNLEIAPASRLVFKPGGLHVMLMGVRAQIVPGTRFPLTIHFERAGAVEIEVVAGSVGALGPPDASDAVEQ